METSLAECSDMLRGTCMTLYDVRVVSGDMRRVREVCETGVKT